MSDRSGLHVVSAGSSGNGDTSGSDLAGGGDMRSRFTLDSLRSADLAGGGDGRRLIAIEETPAGESSDEATVRTVAKMCEYIRAAIDDPGVRAAAQYAANHFAVDGSPGSLVWAVFWYVKHCVKFRQDEATMFRVGREQEYDLLIAPAVLVRMQDPAEDCDGFTMLTAALCAILEIPVYIATVAVSPADPGRWSHVFAIADVNGSIVPLDTSHGRGPGWMVPRERINRFQAWDLDGHPVGLEPAKFRGLHGYVRSGFGDDSGDGSSFIDIGSELSGGAVVDSPTASTEIPLTSVSSSSGPSLSTDLTNFFTALTGQAASVAKVAETPVTSITLPNGTVVSGVSASAAGSLLSSSSLSS